MKLDRQTLIDRVLTQIVRDFVAQDFTALEVLLSEVGIKNLEAFLFQNDTPNLLQFPSNSHTTKNTGDSE